MYANSIVELDRAHLIHPVASWRGHEKAGVRLLQSGKGAWVTYATGRQLLDGFSGLWCVNAGHCREPLEQRHGGRRARVRGTQRIGQDFSVLAAVVNLKRLATLGIQGAGPVLAGA